MDHVEDTEDTELEVGMVEMEAQVFMESDLITQMVVVAATGE